MLVPGTDTVRMAHPFSAVAADLGRTVGVRQWYDKCIWAGLAILALLGDGALDTHSPATDAPVRLQSSAGRVSGAGLAAGGSEHCRPQGEELLIRIREGPTTADRHATRVAVFR